MTSEFGFFFFSDREVSPLSGSAGAAVCFNPVLLILPRIVVPWDVQGFL